MIINSIKVNAVLPLSIDLEVGANLITGFTSDKKTLLFLIFKYMLGSSGSTINWDHANEVFGGKIFDIELVLTDDNLQKCSLKRVPNSNEIFYSINNSGLQKLSLEDYKKLVESFYGLKRTEVPNGKRTTSFTYSEYMKMFFIEEANIYSTDRIVEYDGLNNVEKAKNLFKYLITGISADKKILEESKKWEKREDEIKGFERATKFLSETPKVLDFKRFNEAQEKAKKINDELLENKIKEKNIGLEIKAKKLELNRLINYKKSIEEILNDALNGIDINEIFELEELSNIDYMYFSELKKDLEDLVHSVSFVSGELNNLNFKMNELLENKERLEKESYLITKILNDLSFVSDYYEKEKIVDRFKQINSNKKSESDFKLKEYFDHINSTFEKNIELVCTSAQLFLKDISLESNVSFDKENFTFLFNNCSMPICPKGTKPFLKLSVFSAILDMAKQFQLIKSKFLMCDTLWIGSDFKNISKMEFKANLIKILKDKFEQFIIFENENNSSKLNNVNYIYLNKQNE